MLDLEAIKRRVERAKDPESFASADLFASAPEDLTALIAELERARAALRIVWGSLTTWDAPFVRVEVAREKYEVLCRAFTELLPP